MRLGQVAERPLQQPDLQRLWATYFGLPSQRPMWTSEVSVQQTQVIKGKRELFPIEGY